MSIIRHLRSQAQRYLKGYLFSDEMQLSAARWFRDRGDQKFKMAYPLNEDSVVFDCGGYEGEWTAAVFEKFGCEIHVFEPVPEFARVIERRFRDNSKVHMHSYGLTGTDELTTMNLDANASSVFGAGGASVQVQMRDVVGVLSELKVPKVDLIKINIEGGEYPLLERLIAAGLINRFEFLLVQFHNFVPQAEARRLSLRSSLERTHALQWDYPFIWESWRRKNNGR
jgi:FkbM family methyltransferase